MTVIRSDNGRRQRRIRPARVGILAGSVALAATVLAGCGGGTSTTGASPSTAAAPSVSAVPSIAAMVPAEFTKRGVINDITYNDAPPDEYVSNGKLVGWE